MQKLARVMKNQGKIVDNLAQQVVPAVASD